MEGYTLLSDFSITGSFYVFILKSNTIQKLFADRAIVQAVLVDSVDRKNQ